MKTTVATNTRQFIELGARAFEQLGCPCGMYSFMAAHGVEMFAPARLPRKYRPLKGPMKMCFHNAATAALKDRSLIYCEGYASSLIPVLHAWCLDPKGRVLELTWGTPGADYFGIPFQRGFLLRQALRNQSYGLLDQMQDQFGLVRGKYPKEEWWESTALTRLSASVTVNKEPRGQAGA